VVDSFFARFGELDFGVIGGSSVVLELIANATPAASGCSRVSICQNLVRRMGRA
jgi:hypothetical protein